MDGVEYCLSLKKHIHRYIHTYIKKKLHAHNVIYTGTASLSVKKIYIIIIST